MPEGISDIGDNEDIDSIVKKYRTETEIGALNLARGIYYEVGIVTGKQIGRAHV